jgi:hypothetical protein
MAVLHSWLMDPREIFSQQILMWDNKYLYDLAHHIIGGTGDPPPEPFNTRIIYPTISYALSVGLHIDYVFATYLVDMLVVLLLSYLIDAELKFFAVSLKSRMTILVIFLFSWNFPLRFAGYWPASGFSTQLLSCFIVYKVLKHLIENGRIHARFLLLSMIAIGIREIALLLFSLYLIYVLTWARKEFTIQQKSNLIVLLCFGTSLYLFLGAKFSTSSSGVLQSLVEKFQIYLMTFISNLSIFKYFYSSFSSLGIVSVLLLCCLSIPQWRNWIIQTFNKNELTKLPVLVIMGGHCLYFIGGADLERFLIWLFPFYAIVFGRVLDLFFAQTNRKGKLMFLCILIFQMQVLSPAFPHVFFPNPGFWCSQAGLKTNYSDSKYYGIPAMKMFRNELTKIDPGEYISLRGSQYLVPIKDWRFGEVEVPITKSFCSAEKHSTYFNSYRYEINNLPIPLGFVHNQYEPYMRLASYGDQRVHAILVAQWFMILVFFRRIIRKFHPS